jgi:hypothetical protein
MSKLFIVMALAMAVMSPARAASSISHRHELSAPPDAHYQNGYSAYPQGSPSSEQNEYWHDRAKGSPG